MQARTASTPAFASHDQPHVVTVPSPQQEISSTHLEIRPGTGAALDAAIAALQEIASGDMLQIARLKRSKLVLKDQIQWIEDKLTPDIIA